MIENILIKSDISNIYRRNIKVNFELILVIKKIAMVLYINGIEYGHM